MRQTEYVGAIRVTGIMCDPRKGYVLFVGAHSVASRTYKHTGNKTPVLPH